VSEYRVGTGFDAHALEEGVPLVLGGLEFLSPRGLAGHSDGDVIAHALVDAILGPTGLGDIGTLFPSDDASLEGVSSLKLLAEAYDAVREAGWKLVNADVVFIGNEPRIGPVRREMEALLVSALSGDGTVTVRATTTDGLGFTGRGEGLAAQAVALLVR
jgi:2-C-methyl-D-erythritol 2,4-cyclodiphosphate synthase